MEVVVVFAFLRAFLEWINNAIYEGYRIASNFIDYLVWKLRYLQCVRDERGITTNILMIVVVLVTLMLSVLVVAPLQKQSETQITNLNDSQVSSTWSNIKSATWGSLDMATIIPYVVIFVVIIGLIMAIAKKAG